MRYQEDESMIQWADRVKNYELGQALKQLAQGEPITDIMETMSRRITEKMLYPVIKEIKQLT